MDPKSARGLGASRRVLPVALASVAVLVAPSAAAADIIMSPTRKTWCEYFPGQRVQVTCSASDWLYPDYSRGQFRLRTTGRAAIVRITGDPGEGTVRAKYDQWLYFRGGTARLEGSSRDLRCIWRRSGLRCVNRSDHGFNLRVGLHERF